MTILSLIFDPKALSHIEYRVYYIAVLSNPPPIHTRCTRKKRHTYPVSRSMTVPFCIQLMNLFEYIKFIHKTAKQKRFRKLLDGRKFGRKLPTGNELFILSRTNDRPFSKRSWQSAEVPCCEALVPCVSELTWRQSMGKCDPFGVFSARSLFVSHRTTNHCTWDTRV